MSTSKDSFVPRMSLEQALTLARRHLAAGRWADADTVARAILETSPEEQGAQAVRAAVQAAAQCPAIQTAQGDAEFWNNHGLAFQSQGRLAEAEAAYRQALALRPGMVEVLNNLGNVFQQQGRLPEAVAAYRLVLAAHPVVPVLKNLAVALLALGQCSEAALLLRRVVDEVPAEADSWLNLGVANLGLGAFDVAEDCFQRAESARPNFAKAAFNLGVSCDARGQTERATAAYLRAIDLEPNYADAYNNLGICLQEQGQLSAAEAAFRKVLTLRPAFAPAIDNLGYALASQGRIDESRAFPSLYRMHFDPESGPAEIAAAHRQQGARMAAQMASYRRPPAERPNPNRPLRLGFISADLAAHPVGRFLIPTIEHLDRRRCQVACYCDRANPDALTARFRAAADVWCDSRSLSHQQLAERIAADTIDVLIELAGHTAGNRLMTLAAQPAPLQVTWIGYEGTLGLPTVQYLIADEHIIPPADEPYYSERVLRMPQCYVSFDPPADAPPVGPLPCGAHDRLTFGSLNNPAKFNAEVIACWARLLAQLPEARLLLRYKGLDDTIVRQRFVAQFAAAGVAPERLEIQGRVSYAQYLAEYNRIDVGLDPFPFVGGATTCEALWMGVPVITLAGRTFAGRRGLSYLRNVGLADLVATDPDDYIERAVALAQDRARLTTLRAELRPRMAQSPLCDGVRTAEHLLELLNGPWQAWCRGVP